MCSPTKPDIQAANLGSIWTFYPLTARGRYWLRRYLDRKSVV